MRRMVSFITAIMFAAIPALAQGPGWIGVSIEDQPDRGAIIRRVEPNSPADKAGLRQGDVIVEFNKEAVVGVQQLQRLVRETPVGRTVDVKVRRDNRDETLKVTTDRGSEFRTGRFELDVPGFHILTDRLSPDVPWVQGNAILRPAGIRVEQLTDQLRDFFGVYSSTGVLVSAVDQGSAAERAGLKAGDVITAVGGRNIRTLNDFSREMRTAGPKATLKIFRDKQEREIKLE